MDSRDRVLAACERRRPDRPACSLRFTPEALESLRAHLGVPESDHVAQTKLSQIFDGFCY